jgi:subtilisin family serine protease
MDPMPKQAEPLGEFRKDPKVSEQWNLKKVGLDEATINSEEFQGNYNVKVALLSTGVDYNHEDLIGQIAVNEAEITEKFVGEGRKVNRKDDDENDLVDDVVGYDVVDGDGFAYDRHGAGTAAAGIIAARRGNGKGVVGLMGKVSIYPIRYINDNGQSNVGYLASALELVEKVKPDVVYIQSVELALGGLRYNEEVATVELDVLETRFKALKELAIPVIIGAGDALGNFGNERIHQMITRYDNVVVVTATDKEDQLPLLANSSFENVMTAAPGENVLTTKPFNKYGVVHGTAYAAAHVTAAYALAKSLYGAHLTYEEINPVLVSAEGSDVVPNMSRFSRGGNRLNISRFLSALASK